MSVAIDANLLLYASNESDERHERARAVLEGLVVDGSEVVFVFWPVAMAFLRIATHPAIFPAPLSPDEALGDLEALLRRPRVRSPGEPEGFWSTWTGLTKELPIRGNLVPDAHLVALMRAYGVVDIVSGDRDFRKFDGIRVRDPFR